jgi:ABC-type multidrug transport system ATPase subunit
VLDEPSAGLDPVGTREFYGIVDDIRTRKKLTVILSSHILAEIEDRTDRVAVMKNGSLKAIGSLEELYTSLKSSAKNLPFGERSWRNAGRGASDRRRCGRGL